MFTKTDVIPIDIGIAVKLVCSYFLNQLKQKTLLLFSHIRISILFFKQIGLYNLNFVYCMLSLCVLVWGIIIRYLTEKYEWNPAS